MKISLNAGQLKALSVSGQVRGLAGRPFPRRNTCWIFAI